MQSKMLQNKELGGNLLKASLFALFCWLAFGLFLEDLLFSLMLASLCGIFLLALMLYLPTVQKKKHAALVEGQLPFTLMNMAVELNLGIKFDEILAHAAQQKGALGREFRKVLHEIKQQGASVQEALMHFSERIDSLEVKRSIALFVSVYEQGNKASGIAMKLLAKEMLAKQRAQAKEFSGKLVVYSLLFVAVSAVVPAFFQSFVIVGSMVLQLTLTAQQISLIIIAVFPAIDLLALYYIKAKTPVFMQE